MRRPFVALLVLALAVSWPPVATAASSDIRFDGEIVLVDADTARLVLTLTEGSEHYSPWSLFIPDGMRFVDARDGRGALTATEDGERVHVDTRGSGASYWFQVTFEGPTERHGPYVILPAQVGGAAGSTTTARAIVPDGWQLVGWRADDLTPDASGIFQDDGPMYVEYLALPPGVDHGAADSRVAGESTLREARAQVGVDGVDVRVRFTYDTDVYSSSWTLLLPDNATLQGARSPFGELAATQQGATVTLQSPYPTGYKLGARWFEVEWRLGAPEPHGGGFLKTDISIPGSDTSRTRLDIELDEGLALTGASASGRAPSRLLSFSGEGPFRVALALTPPLAPDQVEIVSSAYVARAPADLANAARLTVDAATQHLNASAGFAGTPAEGMPFYVVFTREPVFDWEAGFYSGGLNTISINAESLLNTTAAADLDPVSTLVHETAHGLLDRLFPDAPSGIGFFDEGLARLSETRLEHLMADQVVQCQTEGGSRSCVVQSARPSPTQLHGFHDAARTFPLGWSTDSAAREELGFLYDYSGFVFHAYEARTPPGTLNAVVEELVATGLASEPQAALEQVVGALLAHAPGLTRESLLHPAREVAPLGLDPFRACLEGLVQPPLPWDEVERPPDCRGFAFSLANVTASMELTGPVPPPPAPMPEEDSTSADSGSTGWNPATPPRVSPEPAAAEPGQPGAMEPESPAAAVDGGAQVEVPAPGAAFALVAGLLAVASARRRL